MENHWLSLMHLLKKYDYDGEKKISQHLRNKRKIFHQLNKRCVKILKLKLTMMFSISLQE